MNVRMTKLSRLIGMAAVGVGLLGSAGCEEAAKQCGIKCSAKGVAEGNAGISGVAALDGFFKAVVNFDDKAQVVAGGIEAELKGLRADFGVESNAELKAAIEAQVTAKVNGGLTIEYQEPRCAVDASASLEARAECEAEVGCTGEAQAPSASVECSGGCEAEVSAKVDCGVMAQASCTFAGPAVACEAECKGTCTVKAGVEGGCEGTCEGTCDGTCEGETGQGGSCNGTCKGTCSGECKLEGEFAAQCNGTCNGECTATGPMLDCTGAVSAKCEAMGDAKVECSARCDGEVTPPKAKVECEASASCDASAKAEANLTVECDPPSLNIAYELNADVAADATAKAAFEAKIGALKARLPRLLAAFKTSNIVLKAGGELAASAKGAVEGTIDAVADGDVDLAVAYKLTSCVPGEITASGKVVEDATASLSGKVDATLEVFGAVGVDPGKMM